MHLAQVDTQPSHVEVLRRLTWFVGSLFMTMPPPPPVVTMHSWSLLTPFYSEDILYSAKVRCSNLIKNHKNIGELMAHLIAITSANGWLTSSRSH